LSKAQAHAERVALQPCKRHVVETRGTKRRSRFGRSTTFGSSAATLCAILATQACSSDSTPPNPPPDEDASTPSETPAQTNTVSVSGTPSSGDTIDTRDASSPSNPFDSGDSTRTDQGTMTTSEPTPDASNGDAGPCVVGSRRCGPSGVEACKPNVGYELVELCDGETPGCHRGECTPCDPGQRTCVDNAPNVCNDDGSGWQAGDACEGNTPACLESTGTCGKCQPSDRQCSGDIVQACGSGGAWENEQTCSGETPVCSSDHAACVECEPGTRECLGATTPRECNDSGNWFTQPECGDPTPVCREALGACGCEEDARRCTGQTPEICQDGSWVSAADCPELLPLCDAATGACVCDSDSRDCTNEGVPTLCVDGAWVEQTACPTDTPLCAAGECWCEDGTERCDGNDHELCINGRWQPDPCSSDTSCDEVSGSCICTATEPECLDSTPRTCIEGEWVSGEACKANTQTCVAGVCQCVDDNLDETTSVTDPALGCGQRWDLPADDHDPWTVFDSKVHVDQTTSLLWYQASGQRNVAEALQYCDALNVVGYDDWRLPTIDDVRQLIDGCEVMEAGGGCPLGAECTETTCNSSESCPRCEAGEGPHELGFYLRPNVRITGVVLTTTECSDCSPARVWVYYPEGYFTRLATDLRQPTYCVRLSE
jgi:hypothetical protein